MPAVLVTRPKEWGEELVERIRTLGYDVFHEPLLTVRYLDTQQPSLSKFDCVIITSRTAAWAIQQKKKQLIDLFSLPCFCVGEQTAKAAQATGFCNILSVQSTGQRLAEEMLKHIGRGANALHICGTIKSPEPQALLEREGIKVSSWVVYDTDEAGAISTEIVEVIRKGVVDAVLLLSPHTAQVWEKLVRQHDLQSCCGRLMAIGLSDSVNNCLNANQYAKVSVPSSPTQDALIATLCEALPVS